MLHVPGFMGCVGGKKRLPFYKGGPVYKKFRRGEIKMSRLKYENLKKCVSLLREFIDEAAEPNNKKVIAKMALGQLQKIKAGISSPGVLGPMCSSRPRANGVP